MARTSLLLLLLGALMSLVAASSAPTFCKCTCFKNSTIIPLGPKSETTGTSSLFLRDPSVFDPELPPVAPRHAEAEADADADDSDSNAAVLAESLSRPRSHAPRSKSKSCSECTKAFCLSQGIDFCKKAEEADVTTLCFQRDSNKDKIIVWGFIACTVGLLGWAAFKRVAAWRQTNPVGGSTASYAPMPGNFR